MAEPSLPGATSAESPTDEAEQLVSLAAELCRLGDAVNAAVLLIEALTQKSLPAPKAAEQVHAAVGAVLELVQARLDQVRRVVSGVEDPATILSPTNKTGEPQPGDDPDVRLRPWTAERRTAYRAQQKVATDRNEEREKPTPARGS
ncbi:hypothetical protein [Archangium lipolyticum]|uniref:hypothetical protein n=1 Tax=Archangium lipolyticum TaxID=2970465 RepID=UPI00214A6727|nr:hypothetical protein [Archangium lipolyticum]